MEKAVRKPSNPAMRIALILLCLVLASSYLVAGMLAKYTTSDSDGDTARVAKFIFRLSDTGTSHFIDLSDIKQPGDSKEYEFTVSSAGSEITEQYRAIMQLNGSMPLVCTLEVGSDTATIDRLAASDVDLPQEKELTGVLNSDKEFKLTVEWPADKNDLKYASGSAVGELILTVTGIQVD